MVDTLVEIAAQLAEQNEISREMLVLFRKAEERSIRTERRQGEMDDHEIQRLAAELDVAISTKRLIDAKAKLWEVPAGTVKP